MLYHNDIAHLPLVGYAEYSERVKMSRPDGLIRAAHPEVSMCGYKTCVIRNVHLVCACRCIVNVHVLRASNAHATASALVGVHGLMKISWSTTTLLCIHTLHCLQEKFNIGCDHVPHQSANDASLQKALAVVS